MIDGLDHLVLTVRDLRATVTFYVEVLGMQEVRYGEGRTALRFGRQKLNLHEAGNEFDPKADRPTPGSADLCFLTTVPLEQVTDRLRAAAVAIVEGPVLRTGAVGTIRSIYFRDPDGNLIEVANEVPG